MCQEREIEGGESDTSGCCFDPQKTNQVFLTAATTDTTSLTSLPGLPRDFGVVQCVHAALHIEAAALDSHRLTQTCKHTQLHM